MTSAARRIETPEDLRAVMQAGFTVSDEQWAAISSPLEPAVVIAGAGSGKTALMAARVVYLVVNGQVRPSEILGLTFTTKATAELRHKIRSALRLAGVLADARVERDRQLDGPLTQDSAEEDVLEPTVATYNAYAAGLLSEHGLRIGHEPDTRVLTDASRYQLAARTIDRYTGQILELSDHPATVINYVLALDGAMSEHLVSPEQVLAHDAAAAPQFQRAIDEERADKNRKTYLAGPDKVLSVLRRRAELLRLVERYRGLKQELGLMDFGDQIALAARLAHDQPEVGELQRATYKVVLLDEYQDTSIAQAQLLSDLFSGPTPRTGRGHAVTAVGDPNQAIYGWRGASVSNILGFEQTFPTAGAGVGPRRYSLTVNRRSDRRIVEAANRVAGPLYAALPQLRPLRPKPEADQGEVRVASFESIDDELAWLAAAVLAEHERDRAWSDIGVLTRDNRMSEAVFDRLSAAGVPVEIVGLSGLLRLPEVAEVVANLELAHDVTANTAVLTLLTGPRWAIGPRDLRLLAVRALKIAGVTSGREEATTDIAQSLVKIADGLDPAELPALADALEDPGEAAYSSQSRERFELLAAELRMLRRHAGEPILDLVRRVVETTGVDVELASSISPAATARRDNLDLFLKSVAEFQAVDGDVTLPALLAYLSAEDEMGNGLDVATPTEADSVKLLTVHRAKGLEWPTVFCAGVCKDKFPSAQPRLLWVGSPAVLPSALRGDAVDQPQLEGFDLKGLDSYREANRNHDLAEDLRLAYVAFTRAQHRLFVSSHVWARRARPLGPSPYQVELRDQLRDWGERVEHWRDTPPKGTANPFIDAQSDPLWPLAGIGVEAARRRDAAKLVQAAADARRAARAGEGSAGEDEGLDVVEAAKVAQWDVDLNHLLVELHQDRSGPVVVPMPASLSATAMARLREDPEEFVRDLARPMPRRPSAAARFGTRFHAWVEARFGQQDLFDPDDLPGRADTGIEDEEDLRELIAKFEAGPFADRVPVAVEPSFALVLGGQVVRGRIDAVYAEADGSVLVVDWKTNREQTADPLQLAIYRLAWAELHGLPLERVRAVFHYVRTGRTVQPAHLPERRALEELIRID